MTDLSADAELQRIILTKLGLDPAVLEAAQISRTAIPTFATYIPVVSAAVSEATRQTYSPYWNRILEHWSDLRLTDPTPSSIKHAAQIIKHNVVIRRNARAGRGAIELYIAALRCIYRHAIADGLIKDDQNPAARVRKPSRLPSGRFALAPERVEEINQMAACTGNDPELDCLLLRFHEETAARRGGALAIRYPYDLDADQCLVRLHEKGDTDRWQPVSPILMQSLLTHAKRRHSPYGGQLLRYRTGQPLTSRRYDSLWTRLGQHLPWVAAQQVTVHWLRYTTLTWVERNISYAVARAYAGHFSNTGNVGATATYVRAGLHEVAAALQLLTGEPHPLAQLESAISPLFESRHVEARAWRFLQSPG